MPNADFPQEQLKVWLVDVGTTDLLMHMPQATAAVMEFVFVRAFLRTKTNGV